MADINNNINNLNDIDLQYIENAIDQTLSNEIHEFYLSIKDNMSYVTNSYKSRKYKHYGFIYDYATNNINDETDAIPDTLTKLIDIAEQYILDKQYFNQCIINHYLPGQGINKHYDNKKYGDHICSFTFNVDGTIGDICRVMSFINVDDKTQQVDVPTKSGSLYIMSDEVRYNWYHKMNARKSDKINGIKYIRSELFSITFRHVP